jgi:hypothetical protein
MLKQLEIKYECGGACYVPLFYATKDISEGRPQQDCVESFLTELLPPIMVVSIIAGLIFLTTFSISIFMWCKLPPENADNTINKVKNSPPAKKEVQMTGREMLESF